MLGSLAAENKWIFFSFYEWKLKLKKVNKSFFVDIFPLVGLLKYAMHYSSEEWWIGRCHTNVLLKCKPMEISTNGIVAKFFRDLIAMFYFFYILFFGYYSMTIRVLFILLVLFLATLSKVLFNFEALMVKILQSSDYSDVILAKKI